MQYILKASFRSLIRKPTINLINLFGLAISLSLVIILSLYTYRELTANSFYKNADRIYMYGENRFYTPGILKEQIDLSLPDVEEAIRIAPTWEPSVFQVEGHDPIELDLVFADDGFFRVFDYKVIEGDPNIALKEPMSLVITEDFATKFFGKEQAVGKLIKLDNSNELMVMAVIQRPKESSSVVFDAMTSIASRRIIQPSEGEYTNWSWMNFQTFLLLRNNTKPDKVVKDIAALVPENERNNYNNVNLIPLRKLYFSKLNLSGNDHIRIGDKNKVILLIFVAGLVLVIALINFVNISSSQWLDRIQQIGVMKVIGAKRFTILKNILVEAFLFFFFALIVAAFLSGVFMPMIHDYTGIIVDTELMFSWPFLLIAMGVSLSLSFLFSLIPAFNVSSSNVLANLKNDLVSQKGKNSLRGILVAAQFAITIVLISFTILVQKQVNFGSSNFSFDQNNTVAIKITPQLSQKKNVIRKILYDNPYVGRMSMCQYYPGKNISQWGTKLETESGKKNVRFDTFSADSQFFDLMGLQLISGRFYSDELASDSGKVVVNETFVRQNKIENPLGKRFTGNGAEIIGVVKDFNYKAVNVPVGALVIQNVPWTSYCLFRLQTSDFNSLSNSLQNIKKEISALSPSFPVEVSFFDQAIEKMYQDEIQFRKIFSLFAGIAIVICCMGILAMSFLASQRRTKEIGIRKVNGAKISEILTMLNKDFIKWVAVAFVIACPIAWYAMNKWLENFAYKTTLSWWIFALVGLLALGIALLTVSFQSWKAATRNPVEALRYE